MTVEQFAITLTPEPESIGVARRYVAGMSPLLGITTDGEVLALLTSELVSNAIDLGAGDITVTVRQVGGRIRVEVRDSGYGTPELLRPSPLDQGGGRGLMIVDELAAAWGVDQFLPGKIVWFEVETKPTRDGRKDGRAALAV